MTPEDVARATLDEIERTGHSAEVLLKRALRERRWLDDEGRRRVAWLVHGIRCHRIRLDYIDKTADRIALFDADRAGEHEGSQWPTDPIERLHVERSMPRFVAEALFAQYGELADEIAATLNTAGPVAIRSNTLAQDRNELATRLVDERHVVTAGHIAPHALRFVRGPVEAGHVARAPDIRGSKAWQEGRFEVQDEASQMVAEAVGAQPGETVIDLCAGAGGKTLALAAAMEDRGSLFAADIDRNRLHDLRVRLDRVRTSCTTIVDLTTDEPPRGVDRVLVDAPCSAIGTWRRGPDRKWRLREADVARHVRTQHEILHRAAGLVRPGGRIVYATCTLLAVENLSVATAIAELDGLELESTVEYLPHVHDTDGFFIATMRRPAAAVSR